MIVNNAELNVEIRKGKKLEIYNKLVVIQECDFPLLVGIRKNEHKGTKIWDILKKREWPEEDPEEFYLTNRSAIIKVVYEVNRIRLSDLKSNYMLHGMIVGNYADDKDGYTWKKINI